MRSEAAHNLRKNVQTLQNIAQNPPQILPKSFQDPPKIDPKGVLESILDPCLKKTSFRTSKKWAKVAQERPKDAPERPNPLPNWAQDRPKSIFFACFGF